MTPITTAEQLRDILALPQPPAVAEGLFERAPAAAVHLAPARLDDLIRASLSPAAVRWVDDGVVHDPAAVARVRLQSGIWRDAAGAPWFDGEARALLDTLPAGVVDRLLLALDTANGYRPPQPEPSTPDAADAGAQYADGRSRWLDGLLPQAPDAALCVHAYDFATLIAAEQAAQVALPGGQVTVDVAAWPRVIAAVVRGGPEAAAARLLDEATARDLPCGAARAIVECADALSEMGVPQPGVRFLR